MALTPQHSKTFPALHFNGMPVITDPETADEMRAAGWYGEPVKGSSEAKVLEAQHIAAMKAADHKRCFIEMTHEQAAEFMLLFKDSKYFGTPYMHKEVTVGPPIYAVKKHTGEIVKKTGFDYFTSTGVPDPILSPEKHAEFQKAYYAELNKKMKQMMNKMPSSIPHYAIDDYAAINPFTKKKDDSDEITEDF